MVEPVLHDAGAPRTWEVAALVQAVGDALAARFGAVAVRGELAGFSRAASGHCYFTLKDARGDAALRCAMFRRAAALLDFSPRDGQQVELRGRLAVYEARGELQMVVEAMRTAGAGALMEQFLRLKARLQAEGLFDAQRKRALPPHPRCVAVITSLQAAALRDVASTFARRAPHVQVHVYPAAVQGTQAPAELLAALAAAERDTLAELVVVCRGGGSLEDLWAFNDEHLARALAHSRLPVISGVGHESDVTLVDLVADVRAATPTAAAELAAPAREDSLRMLDELQARQQRRVRERLDQAAQRLDRFTLRLLRPAAQVQLQRQRLEALQRATAQAVRRRLRDAGARLDPLPEHLGRAARRVLAEPARRLDLAGTRLAALDPARVLARGYAWVSDATGSAVVSAAQVSVGQTLRTTWADGDADVRVQQVRPAAAGG